MKRLRFLLLIQMMKLRYSSLKTQYWEQIEQIQLMGEAFWEPEGHKVRFWELEDPVQQPVILQVLVLIWQLWQGLQAVYSSLAVVVIRRKKIINKLVYIFLDTRSRSPGISIYRDV